MTSIYKRAFSSANNIVFITILLLVAVASLVYVIKRQSVQIGWKSNLAQTTAVTSTSDKVILNGSATSCGLENISIANGVGDGGGNALLVATTRWAGAMIQFSNACGGAINFGIYDRIEFHIKGATATPDPLRVYTYSYIAAASSQQVSVNPTGAWTTISIPISSLKNAWDLNNVQELRFMETANGSSYYIDSIVLKAAVTSTPPPTTTIDTSPTTLPTTPLTTTTTAQPITVKGWTAPADPILSGSTVSFLLNWNGGVNVPRPDVGWSWTVFVHVTDSSGRDAWSSNVTPNPEAVSWSGSLSIPATFVVPANTQPGTYNVLVGLYSGNQRLPLNASSPARDMGGYRYWVGSFSVTSATNSLTPVINSISLTYCIKGVYFCRQDIQGNNFALTGNNVKLRNTTTGAVYSLGINNINIGNLSSSNGKQIVADVPASIPEGKYVLTNTVVVNGVAKTSNGVAFDILPVSELPTITGVSPATGALGQTVTISGTNFVGPNTVQIGPLQFNNLVTNTNGNLTITLPSTMPYTSYLNTPLRVSVDNDAYGYSGDNTSATPYYFTITSGSRGDTSAPSQPTNLVGTAANSTQVNLTWIASNDNVGVSGYQVFRNGAFVATTTSPGYADKGLSPATTYVYSVKAFDAAYNTSAASNAVSVTTPVAAGGVTVVLSSNKTGVMYGEQAVLSWTSTNATACTATDGADDRSDGWAGSKATSGTFTVAPSISTGYTITCSGGGMTSAPSSVVVSHIDANAPTDVTYIGLNATVQKSPAKITLNWYPDNWNQNTAVYTIYRSTVIGGPSGGTGSWTQIGNGTNITSFVDTNVVAGTAYEYRVNRANTQHNGEAYIYTGIEIPQITNRGKIILLVDSRFSTTLATKIERLKDDLTGDGWQVITRSVPSGATPDSVKSTIKADYTADPTNVKAVLLLGHIPVYRSGSLNPDGHGGRQMPADGFYGDMDGAWSASTTYIPSDIELEVGRIDMYNMPSFAPLTETDLLSNYLDKDHAFRTKAFDSTVYTNPKAAAMTSSTNPSFQRQFFGPVLPLNIESIYYANLRSPTFWDNLENSSYLWFSRGGGGGQYTGATGVGYSSDFAKSPGYKVVFNTMFASWFVEWDVQDNFLRAPLAAKGYALTNAWSDNPAWVFFHMGLGREVGFSAKTSQNNDSYYNIPGYAGLPNSKRGVHMNLMGDPTLRMHVVAPVPNVARTDGTGTTAITWGSSPDAGRGYNVYKSANGKNGPFTLITATPVAGNSFTDTAGGSQYTYMVRAVKLEIAPSGSYVNQSQGVFAVATQ